MQAVIVAVLAAALGGVLSVLLGPLFPMRVDIPQVAFLLLPVVAITIGVLASLAGLRRAVTVDPALALEAPDLMGDLRIKDLVVEYASGQESVRPINGLNLDVSAGSLAILLGPSGCGKTTLLSCLGGILRPSAGRIEFGDIDITKLDASALSDYRRNTVGIVFQAFQPGAKPDRDRRTSWCRCGPPAWVGMKEARERAAELLTRVGLSNRMTHRPGDLSGGQQQRVAVARAIALDPPLLIADEPTTHLDYIQVEEVLRLIRELASGNGWSWSPPTTPGCCRLPTGSSNWCRTCRPPTTNRRP